MFRSLAGHEQPGEAATAKPVGTKPKQPKAKAATAKPTKAAAAEKPDGPAIKMNGGNGRRDVGLTVRIEINLPAGGSKETYDNIFKSIRANLIDE